MHKVVQYPLPADRRIRWGRFPLEVVLWAMPWLSVVALAIAYWRSRWLALLGSGIPLEMVKPLLLIVLGTTWILRISYRYRGRFEDAAVGSLLEDVEVSEMRPRSVRLEGEILGRGVPGAFWSPDLVLRDPTGILFVLNRQTIPFARILFAINEAESFIGRQVQIEGWFRRGLTPYVEMARMTAEGGGSYRSYFRWIQYALAVLAVAAGFFWLFR